MFLKKDNALKLINKKFKPVYVIAKMSASGLKINFMKRILFMLFPVILVLLAFRPVKYHTITGTITGDNGIALSAASVVVKGTGTATLSAKDGTYSINVNDKNATLVFSAIGYESQEIGIRGRKTIDVVLASAQHKLSEVVIREQASKRKTLNYNKQAAPMTAQVQFDRNAGYFYEKEQKYEDFNTEDYDHINENKFLKVSDNPLSTFSIDVDAASYSNVRRFLNQGQLPPSGAVRIEEMINYFHYDYPQPKKDDPFSINTEISDAPWNRDHKLVLIGMQGKKIPTENLPASNLVFLIDVSGSMDMPNKLPLVKASMKMLVDQLREKDRVAIVV